LCVAGALAGCLLWSRSTLAAPVSAATAASAVQGWLRQDHRPLGKALSPKIKSTETVRDAAGNNLYYVVHLDPAGFVVLSADDLAEPIIAFSASGDLNTASKSAVADMVKRDLPQRLSRAQAQAAAPTAGALQARSKWHAFLAGSENPPPDAEENGSIVVASQIWVAPFVQTLWSQQTDLSLNDAVYNYYTPPYGAGNVSNDPCGCVATCLAEVMYYFQYPTAGVGTASFDITNVDTEEVVQLRGGDGHGGPYQWSQMPLSPNNPTTPQAEAIGDLTFDAAATVNMQYTPSGSSAYTYLAQQALLDTFMYANVDYDEQDARGLSAADLLTMINPNLDARLPVMLGIESTEVGGHCLLSDGYGYSSSTLFYHVNTGWGGDDDIWYALPEIDTADNGDYTLVQACAYNIFTNGGGGGQIISGRVTDPTGAPVAGASITAAQNGGGIFMATADASGIYALAEIPAATYTLTVTNPGYSSASHNYTTTSEVDYEVPSGNVWGANFVLSPPLLAIPETGFASVGPSNGPFSVASQSYNLTNTSASSVNWVLSNTNNWLSVTSSNGTLAAHTVTNLTIALNDDANSLAAGTYAGSVWFTNLNNGFAQQLSYSLSVETADYPIAVTGFNMDVVVESNAIGGDTTNYADAFDNNCPFVFDFYIPPNPVCFYEQGLVAFNLLNNFAPVTLGLPPGGLFTSELDGMTTFQFAPYDSSNVLYLTPTAPSGSLTLSTPAAYKSLSVLAASAYGGGEGTLVIHFSDGTASSAIDFDAEDYLVTNSFGLSPAAISDFGLLTIGNYNEYGSTDTNTDFPTLYQTSIDLHTLGLDAKLITSVTFTRHIAADVCTGVFALSGTEAPYGGNYNLTVTASPSADGKVSGGGPFAAGSTNTVTATTNSGFVFTDWTEGGVVVSTSTSYPVILTSNSTLIAHFSPLYTITVSASPTNAGTVTGGGPYPVGSTNTVTATANSGFIFTNWTKGAVVESKSNDYTFALTASETLVANFVVTVAVTTNGFGTVTPNVNGKTYKPGTSVTLTATADSGVAVSNMFLGWTGSITTNKSPLIFKAESNMVLQANFIPNPFLPFVGMYNGLFTDANGIVTEETAGMLKGLALGVRGTYSATLLINGTSHVIIGTFTLADLQVTNTWVRTAAEGGPLTVVMSLNSGPPPQVTGQVIGTNWMANLTADRATNTVPSAEYTLLLPPDTNTAPDASPEGAGYALITNYAGTARAPALAKATITGSLADGTSLGSQTVPVSEDGYIPIYDSLYTGKGLLLGWINLASNTNGTGLTWIHPNTSSGLYTNGFTNILLASQLLQSPWTNLTTNTLLTNLTNLSLLATIDDNTTLTNFDVKISNNFAIGKVSGPTNLSGSINPKTGVFTVTIGSGVTKVSGYGAMLDETNGGGYFLLNKINAGAVQLGP
jgi:hypothetical protein